MFEGILSHVLPLVAYMVPVVYLAEQLAVLVDYVIETMGAPDAVGGVAIAILVATPEAIGAVRAAFANRVQRSINIFLGSVLSTIDLTVPAMIAISNLTGHQLVLGVEHTDEWLLILTLGVSIVTFASGHANVMQGCAHLILFAAYILLMFQGLGPRQARRDQSAGRRGRTRHLNIWVGAGEALFSLRNWQEAADTSLSLDGFEGQDCHLGLEFASRTDLAAMALVFPSKDAKTGRATYAVFARCYMSEAAVAEARNPSYPGWAAAGHLVVTAGNETNFDEIEADVRQLCSRFNVVSAGYDPWQSAQMSQRLRKEGVPCMSSRRPPRAAIIELDAAMRARQLRHDGDPVLTWCLAR
jgi:Ca2+/Na+ antiporter